MKEYLVKRTESNGITFKELTDLIKCIQNPAKIIIDYSNVRKTDGEKLKKEKYIAILNNGAVKLIKEKSKSKSLDTLYRNGLVNAYLEDINYKIKIVGKEEQIKIV